MSFGNVSVTDSDSSTPLVPNPEPSSLILMGAGLGVLVLFSLRSKNLLRQSPAD